MMTTYSNNLDQIESNTLYPSIDGRDRTPSTLSSTTDRVVNILPSQGKI